MTARFYRLKWSCRPSASLAGEADRTPACHECDRSSAVNVEFAPRNLVAQVVQQTGALGRATLVLLGHTKDQRLERSRQGLVTRCLEAAAWCQRPCTPREGRRHRRCTGGARER